MTPFHPWRHRFSVLTAVCTLGLIFAGGLVTSTFCEFLIHPGLFWKFSGKDAERLITEHDASAMSTARSASRNSPR